MIFSDLNSSAPLTPRELISITALVTFIEHENGFHIENTKCHLAAEFKVADVKDIKRRDFDRAVKFLVDLHEQKQELKAN